MALLERVTTLIRANLNDLIDAAEDPVKLVKQLILDMQNQLLQVKTQVAVAIADQHLLEKQHAEHRDRATEWRRRAELAVDKQQDDLARAALQRALSYQRIGEQFHHQAADQAVHVETLKVALQRLEQKLTEVQARGDLLIAQHRRTRALRKATGARSRIDQHSARAAFERVQRRVLHAEATTEASGEIDADNLEDRLAALEREDEVERLLSEIKARRASGQ
jgi:phage shock protein A